MDQRCYFALARCSIDKHMSSRIRGHQPSTGLRELPGLGLQGERKYNSEDSGRRRATEDGRVALRAFLRDGLSLHTCFGKVLKKGKWQ